MTNILKREKEKKRIKKIQDKEINYKKDEDNLYGDKRRNNIKI